MVDQWVERWNVKGTSGKEYVVAKKKDGTYGCSCPAWKFQKNRPRVDCQHIMRVLMEHQKSAPTPVTVNDNFGAPIIRSLRLDD